ncbi:hypothetical protein BKA93DRAFT_706208, partial [Sparassis latifolia]
ARRVYTEPAARHDLGRMNGICSHCSALHWINERVVSKSTRDLPVFTTCCNQGKVRLPAPAAPPEYLAFLFSSAEHEVKEFRENIHQYNSALAFTSLGVKLDQSVNVGSSQPIVRINGELCHRHGALLPPDSQEPAYAQLYIYDPHDALKARMRRNNNLDRNTMEQLQTMLATSHRYAHAYRHAHEILAGREDVKDVAVHLRLLPTQDRRRYNLPTADELAVILPGDGSEEVGKRDIILRQCNGPLQRIHEGNAAYGCLYYVLLFPYGEHGWH